MVHSAFLRSGWNTVRSASLAKGGTSKKRLSLNLQKVLTQNNVSPRNLQTALTYMEPLVSILWEPQTQN